MAKPVKPSARRVDVGDESSADRELAFKQTRRDMLAELQGLVKRLGRRPTVQEVAAFGRFRVESYEFYFGGVDQALDDLMLPRVESARPVVSPEEEAASQFQKWQKLLPRPDQQDAVLLLHRIVTRFQDVLKRKSRTIPRDDFIQMLSYSDLSAFITPLWQKMYPGTPVPETFFLIARPIVSALGDEYMIRFRADMGSSRYPVQLNESLIAIAKQAGADGKVRIVPQQIIQSPQMYEMGLAIARGRGLTLEGNVEEAFYFGEIGFPYLRTHWVTKEDIAQYFQKNGASSITRLQRIQQVAHQGSAVPASELEKPIVLDYTWSVPHPGAVASLKLYPLGQEPAGSNHHSVVFRWSRTHLWHHPTHVTDELGVAVVKSWLHGIGVPITHVVEEALMRHAVAGDHYGHSETLLDDMMQYADQHQPNPLGRLVQIASALDDQINPTMSTILVRMRVHGMRQRFASLRLIPWVAGKGLKQTMSTGQLLWTNRGGDWRLIQYKGTATDEMAMHFSPELSHRDEKLTDAALTTLTHRGHLVLYWDQLIETLGTVWRRQVLKNTLWSRDHPGEIPPQRYALVVIKSQVKATTRVVRRNRGGSMALGLKIIPLKPGESPDVTREYAALIFERGVDGRDHLQQVQGRGAQEMAEAVLSGNGVIFTHSIERHIALRLLASDIKQLPINSPLTADEVLGFARIYGHEAPHYLARFAHGVRSDFPESPETIALSGFESKGQVGSVKLWHGKVNRGDVAEQYFWIQWVKQPDGSYVGTKVSRNFGKKVAAAMQPQGTAVFAPDADEIVKHSEALRPKSEGFTSLDGAICKEKPLITPAELVNVPSLEKLPVQLKDGERGFSATSVDWKKLATPPSTERYAGPVDLPEFVGSDTFLPEPPLGMVVVSYAALGGVVAVTGALVVLAPEVELISLSHQWLAPIPATLF